MNHTVPILAAAALLVGCGAEKRDRGATVPAQFAGTWSSDCASPFVTFDDDGVTAHPVTKPYALTDAKVNGATFRVSYVNPDVQGPVTDVYAVEGDTLRLTATEVGGKTVATWKKVAMSRCG